jgi:hypothetical protein
VANASIVKDGVAAEFDKIFNVGRVQILQRPVARD